MTTATATNNQRIDIHNPIGHGGVIQMLYTWRVHDISSGDDNTDLNFVTGNTIDNIDAQSAVITLTTASVPGAFWQVALNGSPQNVRVNVHIHTDGSNREPFYIHGVLTYTYQ